MQLDGLGVDEIEHHSVGLTRFELATLWRVGAQFGWWRIAPIMGGLLV